MLYETPHLRVSLDDRIATLTLDFPGMRPNLLNVQRLREIDRALDAIERSCAEKIVLQSAKLSGFCVGFDPESLSELTTEAAAREFAAFGQRVMNRLAEMPCITIAYLCGPVHDAGLDLALACDYRLAVAMPHTSLGYPGLQHGTLSPWGGLTRLTRILGAAKAIEILTAEEPRTAREAHRLGLVDDAFSARRAKIELRTFLDRTHRKPRRWHTPFDGWAARRVVGAYDKWLTATAPVATAAAVRIVPFAAESESAGRLAERAAFASVLEHDEARAAFEVWSTFPMGSKKGPMATLAVIGPLEPVADLCVESLLYGSRVDAYSFDETPDTPSFDDAINTAQQRGRVTPLEADQARARFRIASDETRADLVLLTDECGSALELAETIAKPNAPILAVNANLKALLELCSRTRNLVGMNRHTALEEIVRSNFAAESVAAAAQSFFSTIERVSLIVCETPVVKPLQLIWWDEAVRLVADGLPIELVDRAAKSLGAATGPLETLDGLGLESVVAQLPRVKPLLAAGIQGRPHADGFYVLADDNPTCANAVAQLVLLEAAAVRPRIAEPVSELAALKLCERRLAARLLVAAAKRLTHANPAEIDLAIVRGLGLLARHGGALRFADRRGLPKVIEELQALRHTYGDRFKPPRSLVRLAAARDTFHGDAAGPFAAPMLKRSA